MILRMSKAWDALPTDLRGHILAFSKILRHSSGAQISVAARIIASAWGGLLAEWRDEQVSDASMTELRANFLALAAADLRARRGSTAERKAASDALDAAALAFAKLLLLRFEGDVARDAMVRIPPEKKPVPPGPMGARERRIVDVVADDVALQAYSTMTTETRLHPLRPRDPHAVFLGRFDSPDPGDAWLIGEVAVLVIYGDETSRTIDPAAWPQRRDEAPWLVAWRSAIERDWHVMRNSPMCLHVRLYLGRYSAEVELDRFRRGIAGDYVIRKGDRWGLRHPEGGVRP
jgi:hypothetical protein